MDRQRDASATRIALLFRLYQTVVGLDCTPPHMYPYKMQASLAHCWEDTEPCNLKTARPSHPIAGWDTSGSARRRLLIERSTVPNPSTSRDLHKSNQSTAVSTPLQLQTSASTFLDVTTVAMTDTRALLLHCLFDRSVSSQRCICPFIKHLRLPQVNQTNLADHFSPTKYQDLFGGSMQPVAGARKQKSFQRNV